MKKRVSIQKGFIFGVTAVAVLAVLTGVILKMTQVNADLLPGITPGYVCNSTANLAEKTSVEPTALELSKLGAGAKAYTIKINGKRAPFRMAVGAKNADESVKFSIQLTWLGASGFSQTWTDRVYFVFDDSQGIERRYGALEINETWTGSALRNYRTGNLAILFIGQNYDGCLKEVLNIPEALAASSASPTPTPGQTSSDIVSSATPSATASSSVSATASGSLVAQNSVAVNKLKRGLKMTFFNDKNLDNAVYSTKISQLLFNWGAKAPAPLVKPDGWSDQTTGLIKAPITGRYRIGVSYNDGVRVFLGGKKIIDDWSDFSSCDQKGATCKGDVQMRSLSAYVNLEKDKYYYLRVDHYDNTSGALIKLAWQKPGDNTGEVIPASALWTTYDPNPPHGNGTGLLGSYFNTKTLEKLVFTRKDAKVNFNWGLNAPDARVGKNNFSVRWTGKIKPRFSEEYTFRVTSKDGAKLWVNNELVIDGWKDQNEAAALEGKIKLTAGKLYPITLEYYNAVGRAQVSLFWKSPSERITIVPTSDLYFPGTNVSATPTDPGTLKMTLKPGWNAVSLPESASPIQVSQLRTDPYNFLTFVFDKEELSGGKNVRTWNSSPSSFHKKMGYYIKNTSDRSTTVSFDATKQPNKAILYKGWNLISNSSTNPVKLSDMTYTKKVCTGSSENPITCEGTFSNVDLGDLTYGKAGESKDAYTRIYYIAKPNANNKTPDPFTIYNVADKGGPENVTIPGRNAQTGEGGIFWLYLFK